jgi:hypothetical protein
MIPNTLWQSWKTKDIPRSVKSLADSWAISNPQLEKQFMDDSECSDFILEHFGKSVHTLYLQLPQNIMRADFWRVAVIYINGGYYSDLDVECNLNLSRIIDQQNQKSAVFIKELDNIANFFFGATPKHPALKLTLDKMISAMHDVSNTTSQDFGMHPLHETVREYYQVQGTGYQNTNDVCFLNNEQLKQNNHLVHIGASGFEQLGDYVSWRKRENIMIQERENSEAVVFFTTFHKNGYELYGKEWISSFTKIANYYNKFRAKIYYEGFVPPKSHPSIEWINYETAIPLHPKWKKEYLEKTSHSDYVKTMTVRFSHKAFVIQHALANNSDDYLIWLDGDCVFKDADYTKFPRNLLGDKLLACQVEHNHDLNHVESGILIFNGKHTDKQKFINEFAKWYRVENILSMGEPYDGFIVFKTLLTSKLKYVDLNEEHGKGGIQSDPGMTFCHPEIKDKFIHNIGWTGKNQYSNWNNVFERDDIYKKMQGALFGSSNSAAMLKKKETAFNKLQKLKALKSNH